MRFLAGIAAGALGAMNQEMDENRKNKEEWRRSLFKYYTESVVPTYQKLKLEGVTRAQNAETFGMLFGNPELGKLVANAGAKNGAEAMSIAEKFQLESRLGVEEKKVTGDAPTLPPQVTPNMMAAEGFPGGGLMAPTKQNWWDKGMGKPDIGAISGEVATDIGSLYGVDKNALMGMARGTLNPSIQRLPVDQSKIPPLKPAKDEDVIDMLKQNRPFSNDPEAYIENVRMYIKTRDPEYMRQALRTTPGWQDRAAKLAELRAKNKGGSDKPLSETQLRAQRLNEAARRHAEAKRDAEPDVRKKQMVYDNAMVDYYREKDPLNRAIFDMTRGFGQAPTTGADNSDTDPLNKGM